MRTGLFLGAGASFEAGLPLVWDLTNELKNWLTPDKLRTLNEGWKKFGTGVADEYIELCSILLQDDHVHYEALLGQLEVDYLRNGYNVGGSHYLYTFIVEMVQWLLYYRQTGNLEYLKQSTRYLEGIAGLAKDNCPLWVFTLNHDLVVECIAAEYGIPVYSGLNGATALPRRSADGSLIGQLECETLSGAEFAQAGLRYPDAQSGCINILKIHGAMDLFTFNNGADLLRPKPMAGGVEGVIAALRAVNEELIYADARFPGGKAKAANEIAYADFEGVMQFLRRTILSGAFKFEDKGFQVLPRRFLELFVCYIRQVSHLICIGYGFGDLHINNVIRRWLEDDASRRITIVGPGVRSVPNFILHLIRQAETHDQLASDYLEQFAHSPLTEMERVWRSARRAMREAVRKEKGFA